MRDRPWWAVHREATVLIHPGPAPWGGVGCGILGKGSALLTGRAREGCGDLGEERRGCSLPAEQRKRSPGASGVGKWGWRSL